MGRAVLLIVTRLPISWVLFSFFLFLYSAPPPHQHQKRRDDRPVELAGQEISFNGEKQTNSGSLLLVSFHAEIPGIEFQALRSEKKPSSFLPGTGFRGRRSQRLGIYRECYVLRQVFVFLINTHKHTRTHKYVSASYLESSLAGGNEPC